MDKWWKTFCRFFIHRTLTGSGHIAIDVLVDKMYYKLLILLGLFFLSTGKVALNNNNNISISNIY